MDRPLVRDYITKGGARIFGGGEGGGYKDVYMEIATPIFLTM